jgi:hypothetical protein
MGSVSVILVTREKHVQKNTVTTIVQDMDIVSIINAFVIKNGTE